MTVKFHEKAIAIFGTKQVAEGISAINPTPTGTITTTVGSNVITGVGTLLQTEVAIGTYMFDNTGAILGRVATITTNTAGTFEDVVPASAVPQSVGVMALATAVTSAIRTITGTITTTAGSTAVTGTNFVTDALAAGDTIFSPTGAVVGVIASVGGPTALTLVAGASVTLLTSTYAAKAGAFNTGLGPKNALAVLNLNYSTELSTEAFQYTGDELDRSEETVVKDKFAKFDCETFLPSLGTIIGTDPILSEVPMTDWMQAMGMFVALSTGSQGYAKFTNSIASNTYLTIEVRRSSPDLTLQQKTFTMSNARGTFDLDATVGTRAKLKLNFMGNLDTVADKFTIVPNFTDQKTEHAGSLKSTTITTAQLGLYSGSTEPTYVPTTKTVCFDKLISPNTPGFDYQRYLTGCLDGWSKGAVPTDVTVTILEDKAAAAYNPDNHVEENHALFLNYGSIVGKKVQINYHKLQLANVTASKVATYAGQDLKFRNVGYTDIILS
jgi:hypothetical protein